MSDVPVGDGWWQASDGKWYPPEQHPDYLPPPPTSGDPAAPYAPAQVGAGGAIAPPASVKGLTTALMVLFIITAVLAGLGALAATFFASTLDDARTGRSFRTGTVFQDLNDSYNLYAASLSIGYLAIAMLVLFVIWTWRCHRNLDFWRATGARLGHRMAIASWFIPLFWYVGPYLCISDGYKGADPELAAGESLRTRPRSRIALLWWISSCIANVLLFIGIFIITSVTASDAEPNETLNLAADPDGAYGGAVLTAVGFLVLLVAAILGTLAIRQLGERQQLRSERWRRDAFATSH